MFGYARISVRNILREKWTTRSKFYSSSPEVYDRDPSAHFLDAETQGILKSITQFRFDKIFSKTTVSDTRVSYKFMTNAELENKLEEVLDIAENRLQMPPVVKVKNESNVEICNDILLKNFSDTKFIVTDITYGINQHSRTVAARQCDGKLEHASLGISKRMNQLYFPLSGRSIRTPKMLESKWLDKCLDEKKYAFLLNRLLLQYEPYEKEYQIISAKVYLHIKENAKFDDLRSTRHFGPMAFYFAWHKDIDDLLYDMLTKNFISDCVELISLTYKLNDIDRDYKSIMQQVRSDREPIKLETVSLKEDAFLGATAHSINSQNPKSDALYDECIKFIEEYIETQALKKVQLGLALQNIKDTFR